MRPSPDKRNSLVIAEDLPSCDQVRSRHWTAAAAKSSSGMIWVLCVFSSRTAESGQGWAPVRTPSSPNTMAPSPLEKDPSDRASPLHICNDYQTQSDLTEVVQARFQVLLDPQEEPRRRAKLRSNDAWLT